MKFTCAAEIDAPLEKVVRLFENPDNLNKWITGLVSFTHKSGTPGQPGAKSEIVIQAGKQKIELLETIISNSPPTN